MFRRRAAGGPHSPVDVYVCLRTAAFDITQDAVGKGSSERADVLGAVVDIPSQGGTASIVAMADGTTSMYTSTGGGTIGAGSHDSVARANHALLAALQRRIEMFPADERADLPPADLVQITLITPAGRRRASVPTAAFWGEEPSTVVELISAVHELTSAIRRIEPAG